MKVTLIYPGITECGFNSLKGNEGSWMNHGLAIIASALKNRGHQVDLIDLRRLNGWSHFRQVVNETAGKVVGITMMSVDFNPAIRAAEIIKEIKPETKVFVGGPHPSLCPEELINLEYIDHIIKGEGEITFAKLIADLNAEKKIPKLIQGEAFKNLDDSPWADRSFFNTPEEPFVPFLKPPFVTLIAGRGCKYNCSYCQPAERIMFGAKVRRRSVDNVIDELKHLWKLFSFNSFMIHDDCLTEDREWVIEFCKRYKAEGFKQPFVAQSRADIICKNRDMVESLYDSGLRLFIIGFESGSDRVLKFLRKGCTRAQNIESAQICHELGIKIWANYMLGLPTETNQEVLETLSMLQEIKPYHCSPAFYTPHPGSDLFKYGKNMGVHLITSHDSYRRNVYKPKIKGPDYNFLMEILYKSMALAERNYNLLPGERSAGPKGAFITTLRNKRSLIKIFMMTRMPNLYHHLLTLKKKLYQ